MTSWNGFAVCAGAQVFATACAAGALLCRRPGEDSSVRIFCQVNRVFSGFLPSIVRHQFYPTCDFLQIFHSKVQLAIQGLPFEFRAPAASTCAKIRSEHECARVNAMAVGTAL